MIKLRKFPEGKLILTEHGLRCKLCGKQSMTRETTGFGQDHVSDQETCSDSECGTRYYGVRVTKAQYDASISGISKMEPTTQQGDEG